MSALIDKIAEKVNGINSVVESVETTINLLVVELREAIENGDSEAALAKLDEFDAAKNRLATAAAAGTAAAVELDPTPEAAPAPVVEAPTNEV